MLYRYIICCKMESALYVFLTWITLYSVFGSFVDQRGGCLVVVYQSLLFVAVEEILLYLYKKQRSDYNI